MYSLIYLFVIITPIYRATEEGAKQNNPNNASTDATPTPPPTKYNIEFTFDSDVRCAITIYYFAREEIESKKLV